MASLSVTSSSLPSSSTGLGKLPPSTSKRLTVTKASTRSFEGMKVNLELKNQIKEESGGRRRELVFAAAAAVAVSVVGVAMADEEPKAGTPDSKKKYAPICVTMPTARVCHK